jgi:UDPglucose 6-dehydrogenase
VFCANELEALDGSDGLVVATEWNQFRGIDADTLKARLKGRVVCDLRNVYEPAVMRAKGFTYVAVGR